MLGPTDFVRVGLPPKAMLLYAAADAVPTMAGGPVEFFCTPGSKQVVLGGFHPEAVDEYRWVGRCSPITHRFDDLPQVASQQVIDFRARSSRAVRQRRAQATAAIAIRRQLRPRQLRHCRRLHERGSVADRQSLAAGSA